MAGMAGIVLLIAGCAKVFMDMLVTMSSMNVVRCCHVVCMPEHMRRKVFQVWQYRFNNTGTVYIKQYVKNTFWHQRLN